MQQQVVGANTPVKVTNPAHVRHGQAGIVLAANGVLNQDPASAGTSLQVRFDAPDANGNRDETVAVADLDVLRA